MGSSVDKKIPVNSTADVPLVPAYHPGDNPFLQLPSYNNEVMTHMHKN